MNQFPSQSRSLPLLPLAAVAGILLTACGDDGSSPEEEAAAPPSSGQTFEELVGAAGAAGKPADVQRIPDLAFELNSEGLPSGGSWREHPRLADLDGDGKADLIASNREEDGLNIWRSVPGQAWERRTSGIPDNLMYGGSAAADLDADGHVDVLFAAHKFGLHSFLNDGEMGWTLVEETSERPFLSLDVALGNINGDEHLDAVTLPQFPDRGEGGLGVYFGRGDGSFEFQPQLRDATGKSRNGVQVVLVDMDGNGLDDIFLTAEWSCLILTTHLSADGQVEFKDHSTGLATPPKNMGNTLRAFIPIDVDGDGSLEIAYCRLGNPSTPKEERRNVGVMRWNAEAGSWESFGAGFPLGTGYTEVLSADFNGDQHADLVIIGPGQGAVIYLGDGTGNFEAKGMLPGTLSGGRGAIGDIDGDGKPDITVTCGATKARPDAGAVRTFLNRDAAWE